MRQYPHANCLQVAVHEPITMVNAKWTIWYSGCVHNECTEGCALYCVMCVCVCVWVSISSLVLFSQPICVGAVSPLVVTMTTALGCLSSSRVTSWGDLSCSLSQGVALGRGGEGRGRDRCFSRNSSMLQSSTASPHTYCIVQRPKYSVTPLKIYTGIGNFLQPSAFTGGLDSLYNTY